MFYIIIQGVHYYYRHRKLHNISFGQRHSTATSRRNNNNITILLLLLFSTYKQPWN